MPSHVDKSIPAYREPDRMLRAVVGQSAWALLYRCAGAAVSLVFSVIFARIMNIDEYGVVVSLLSCCGIAATIGLFGQQTQLLRDIPKLLAQQRRREIITEITSRRLLVACCGSGMATALGIVLFVGGHDRIHMLSRWEYAICVLLIVPLALIEMQNAIGCALGSMHLAVGTKEVLWRLSVSLLALAIFLISGKPLVAGLVFGLAVLAIWLSVGVQHARLKKLLDGSALFRVSAAFAEGNNINLRASIPFWVNSVANLMLPTMDTIVVSVIVGPSAGAYYYAANRVALLLEFFITAFSVPAAPYIAKLYHDGDKVQISRIASSAALLSFTAVLGAFVILGFAGHLILGVFGSAFVHAYGLMMLLATGSLASAYLGIGTPALEMTGHQAVAMRITAITAFGGLVTVIIATRLFGVWGAAAVALLLTLAQKIAFAAHIYRADGIDVTAASAALDRLSHLTERFRNKRRRDEIAIRELGGVTDNKRAAVELTRSSTR
jgi:O-antigen/teichoic acid export membrane protein